MAPNPTDQIWLSLLSCRNGIGSTREEPGEALSDAYRYASSRHGGYWGRGAVNTRCGPALRLNPICSQPHLLRTSLMSLTMGRHSRLGRRRDLNRSREDWMNRCRQNGAFITVAGTQALFSTSGRATPMTPRSPRDLSTAPFHVKPGRPQMTRIMPLPATKCGIYQHASLPSTHRPANRPSHSVGSRLPTKGPVRVSVGDTPQSSSCSDFIGPRTERRRGMQTDSRRPTGQQ